jgi:hypothetical protein
MDLDLRNYYFSLLCAYSILSFFFKKKIIFGFVGYM